MLWVIALCSLLLTLAVPCRAAERQGLPYFYPYINPYEATVMETPAYLQQKLPDQVPTRVFKISPFPNRQIPDVFWYQDGLRCSLVYQKIRAPLVIVIAGTGSRFDSPKMNGLQRLLYTAGYHVLSISSPTSSEFIVNGSASMMPGDLRQDAADLYRVMEMALAEVNERVEISTISLLGYSLGATQAAFVAKRDEDQKAFGFHKVLLINPALNLYSSISQLDEMLLTNLPGGIENYGIFVDETLADVAEIARKMGYIELSGEYLYRIYRNYPPNEQFLASLIGFAFRFDSASMIFTADVMNGGGYVVPRGARLTNSTSLTPYSMVLLRTGFVDYFKEYFFPHWHRRNPELTIEQFKKAQSLTAIADYLKQASHIWLIDNEDDIILAPGEIEQLEEIFGARKTIYPTGGHCGNMNHQDVQRFITEYFRQGGRR
ncbi:MAG: alpha/beta hydrolase [Desulfopila sp.]